MSRENSPLDFPPLIRAVESIILRAERLDEYKSIYVDAGQLSKLVPPDSQIVYGRRGTGKTHLLGVFAETPPESDCLPISCDVRSIQDAVVTPGVRRDDPSLKSLKYFQALMSKVITECSLFLDQKVRDGYQGRISPDRAMEVLVTLLDLTNGQIEPTDDIKTTDSSSASEAAIDSAKASLDISWDKPALGYSSSTTRNASQQTSSSMAATGQIRILFGDISACFQEFMEGVGLRRCILLLDEWSSLPLDVQPYLAEWIKRAFLSTKALSVKMACLRHHSNFSFVTGTSRIGFEVGGDVFVGVDLDDIVIYDKNKEAATQFFSTLLFNHLTRDMDDVGRKELGWYEGPPDQPRFITTLFSDKRAFEELIKASEGIPRDFLHIFCSAFRKAQENPQWSRVGVPAVVEAASDWFERDKMGNARPEHKSILSRLINDFVKNRKVKAFLVPHEQGDSIVLQELMSLRLLHLWHRGYASKAGAIGERYNIYAIDYGAYVDLRDTAIGRAVRESMFEDEGEVHDVPPDIDKRRVRHIVLDSDLLKELEAMLGGTVQCPHCQTTFSPHQRSYQVRRLCPECFQPVP